jgi:hypothetical protein
MFGVCNNDTDPNLMLFRTSLRLNPKYARTSHQIEKSKGDRVKASVNDETCHENAHGDLEAELILKEEVESIDGVQVGKDDENDIEDDVNAKVVDCLEIDEGLGDLTVSVTLADTAITKRCVSSESLVSSGSATNASEDWSVLSV